MGEDLPMGFDNVKVGFPKGELVFICAKTNVGKSVLSMSSRPECKVCGECITMGGCSCPNREPTFKE